MVRQTPDPIWIPRTGYLMDPSEYANQIPMIRAGFRYDQSGFSSEADNRWGLRDTNLSHLRELNK